VSTNLHIVDLPENTPENANSLVISGTYGITQAEIDRARDYTAPPRSQRTLDAYKSDWEGFAAWCEGCGQDPKLARPGGVGVYILWLADNGLRVSSLRRICTGISVHLREQDPLPDGWPNGWPEKGLPIDLRNTLNNIALDQAGSRGFAKDPLTVEGLRAMVRKVRVRGELSAERDAAILLQGFTGGYRREELAATRVEHIRRDEKGWAIVIPVSKTDQTGRDPLVKGFPFSSDREMCAVRAMRAWLRASGIREGFLYRRIHEDGTIGDRRICGRTVARIVQDAARAAGLEGDYAGHSLRSGFATAAAKKKKGIDAIMRQTGHQSVEQARKYIKHATVFDDCAADDLF